MLKAKYSAFDLAKYIVQKCITDRHYVNNLQLQRILYFVQEAFLKERDCPAFREPVEAWLFGPVVPEVYDRYRIWGGRSIVWSPDAFDDIREEDRALIDRIVEEKRKIDPWEMVQETTGDTGVWAEVYGKGEGRYKEIPVETIKKHLSKQ